MAWGRKREVPEATQYRDEAKAMREQVREWRVRDAAERARSHAELHAIQWRVARDDERVAESRGHLEAAKKRNQFTDRVRILLQSAGGKQA